MPDPLGRAADDGRPDARLLQALRGWTAAPSAATRAEALAALAGARVFLALAARTAGTEVSATTGLPQERETDVALLSLVGADGRRVLPAFSDGHAVAGWRPDARPLPLPGPTACAAVTDDGADGLVLDPATAGLLLSGPEVDALAAGRVPVAGTRVSTRRTSAALVAPDGPPDAGLLAALPGALRGEPVQAARLLQGPDGPVLGVVPARALPAAELAALADRVARRLGGALPPAGLDLAAVPADGPGHPVPLRRRWRR